MTGATRNQAPRGRLIHLHSDSCASQLEFRANRNARQTVERLRRQARRDSIDQSKGHGGECRFRSDRCADECWKGCWTLSDGSIRKGSCPTAPSMALVRKIVSHPMAGTTKTALTVTLFDIFLQRRGCLRQPALRTTSAVTTERKQGSRIC
jgi:hypothetical protein